MSTHLCMFSLLCVTMILINTLCLSLFDTYVEIIRYGDSTKRVRRDRGHPPVPVHSGYCGHSHVPVAAAIAHPESASFAGVADHAPIVVDPKAAAVPAAAFIVVPSAAPSDVVVVAPDAGVAAAPATVVAAPEANVADPVVVAVPTAVAEVCVAL